MLHMIHYTHRDSEIDMTVYFHRFSLIIIIGGALLGGCAADHFAGYRGQPYRDAVYHGGPQKIPGRVQCAYYDLGGEGVAYHDTDATNHGSGGLNPANGNYPERIPDA